MGACGIGSVSFFHFQEIIHRGYDVVVVGVVVVVVVVAVVVVVVVVVGVVVVVVGVVGVVVGVVGLRCPKIAHRGYESSLSFYNYVFNCSPPSPLDA